MPVAWLFFSLEYADLDAKKAQSKGYAGYLTKPIRKNELLECISAIAGQKKQLQEVPLITKYSVKETPSTGSLRFLLVEDVELNRKLVLTMLGKMKYYSDVAANRQEAVEACMKKEYDLILMEIEMHPNRE